MSAGSIIISLLLATGSFSTDTDRAKKKLREMEKTAKQVGAVIGTAFSVATVALTAMVKNAIDNADAMRDLSIRMGVSTETLSAYGYAATQTGTDLEAMGKGLKVLAKNAADAINPTNEYAKVFDALGIKVTDSDGKLRNLSELIPEIADRFKSMEDGTTKAALAQSLFGRAGLEMTEFLNQGSDGLAKFTERARELGLIVDSDTATAADNFNDTLGDLKKVSEGYALHLAQELLPDLQALASSFTDTATEGNKVKEMASDTAGFLRGLGTMAGWVAKGFNVAGKSIALVVAQRVALGKALQGDLAGALRLSAESAAGWGDAVGLGDNKKPAGTFSNVKGRASTVSANPVDMAGLARALSNPTTTTPKLSEQQKEAKKLLDTYGDLVASQLEQIALFGDTTEAAKVRYQVEHEDLSKLDADTRKHVEALQKKAIANAEYADQLADTAALEGVWADAHDEATQGMIDSWSKAKDEMSVFAEQAGRNMQDSFADFLFDPFEDGLDGMLKGFGDILRRMAAEMIASEVFDAIGAWGKANKGGSGWTGILATFASSFGGQRAGGGGVDGSKLYEVGENGRPEMFEQNGKTYLIPGGDGRVMPATHGMSAPAGYGSAPNVNIKIMGAPVQAESASARMGPDGLDIEIMLKQVERSIAGNIAAGSSPVLSALKGRTNVTDRV